MIKGIGVDILEIERLEKVLARTPNFVNRVFTDNEIAYAEKHKNNLQTYAGRFAAKEAFVKAMGVGIGKEFSWQDIEVINNDKGKPFIRLLKNIDEEINIHLSITHEKKYAVAMVVVESK